MLPRKVGAFRLDSSQLERGYSSVDPMEIVLEEGGPFHTRGHLPEYVDRLRKLGVRIGLTYSKADTRQNFKFL